MFQDHEEELVLKVNQDNYRLLREALERSSASSVVGDELQERAAQRYAVRLVEVCALNGTSTVL